MADMTTTVTLETVTELADGSGFNLALRAADDTAILLTGPVNVLPPGTRMQVDVTLLPPE